MRVSFSGDTTFKDVVFSGDVRFVDCTLDGVGYVPEEWDPRPEDVFD
ncbi:hypothetical protein AB0F52_31745 [Amycolatopsis sp. NPDC024027]